MFEAACFRRLCTALVAAAAIGWTVVPARGAAADAPLIAAASDLQFALEELAEAFTASTGARLKLAFGSSGNFARQIRQGAPFELFFSADEAYAEDLVRAGFTRGSGELYAVGRIVLVAPHASRLKVDASMSDLRAALREGRIDRFAIANPEHAPYGKRAEEALRHAGLWESVKGRLVLGENVSQAAQFALSGSTQGGIIAYSLALSPRLSSRGTYALIPADWHQPLRQRMVLLRNASPDAERFFQYVQTPPARGVLRKYGFVLPGETLQGQ